MTGIPTLGITLSQLMKTARWSYTVQRCHTVYGGVQYTVAVVYMQAEREDVVCSHPFTDGERLYKER